MSGGPSHRDPYAILGLDHNASPKQIKLAYRKLALQYHPDRQQQHQLDSRQQQEASNKFTEISGAYAILSDPMKKSQYDHLYKFGAFDNNSDNNYNGGSTTTTTYSETRDDSADRCNYNTAHRPNNANGTSGSGYKYTENMSGGYYTNKASTSTYSTSTPSASAAAAAPPPPFFNYVGLKKTDSFFDELLHTSKNNKASSSQNENEQPQTNHNASKTADSNNSSNNSSATNTRPRKRRPGIGFSLQSMGKHLSIHIPSKSEIMTSIASGEPLPNHNFGTRVTFSSSQRVSSSRRNTNNSRNNGTTTSLISTTTRIARGQQRTVTRTVCIQPDGRREEVIEENGEVKGRHVEEMCPPPPQSPSTSGGTNGQRSRGWQANQQAATSSSSCHSGIISGLRDCILGPCLGLQGV